MPRIKVKYEAIFIDTKNPTDLKKIHENAFEALQIESATRSMMKISKNNNQIEINCEFMISYEKDESGDQLKNSMKNDIQQLFILDDCIKDYEKITMRRKTEKVNRKPRKKNKKKGTA